jgi:hypothetical protein
MGFGILNNICSGKTHEISLNAVKIDKMFIYSSETLLWGSVNLE